MFDIISEKFSEVTKGLSNKVVTEKSIDESIRQVRLALLAADVNLHVVKSFVEHVKSETVGRKLLGSVKPGQLFSKIVHDSLVKIVSTDTKPNYQLKGADSTVLLVGLQGSGKTSFAGKLASRYVKKGRKVLLVGCDIYRPAANERLEQLAKSVGADFYTDMSNSAPEIAKNGKQLMIERGYDLLIVDTAGRTTIDQDMMQEAKDIGVSIGDHLTLFVVDSMSGQESVNVAKDFEESVGIDGTVLTKLDGDAKGGTALSISYGVGKPIYFSSVGESTEDLEEFHPERMADRLLGLGDVATLVEKASDAFDEKEAKKLQNKMKSGLDFNDLLDQMGMMDKFGSLDQLIGFLPGAGKIGKNLGAAALNDPKNLNRLNKTRAIIQSMTPYERKNPKVLAASRKLRIAKGSGTQVRDVNQLIKQLQSMNSLLKKIGGGGISPKLIEQLTSSVQMGR